jgi:hypothetical protein
MRDPILGQKRRLHANFSSYPFTLPVWHVSQVMAGTSTAELGTKRCVLDLIELREIAPGFVTDGPGNINF